MEANALRNYGQSFFECMSIILGLLQVEFLQIFFNKGIPNFFHGGVSVKIKRRSVFFCVRFHVS